VAKGNRHKTARPPVFPAADWINSAPLTALGNRYWPAFYLVGRDGHIVTTAIGELHAGQRNGEQVERDIRNLLH
jgi:hypothetical protein